MHNIRCFIGKEELIEIFVGNWMKADVIILPQGFSMIFLTDDLFDDITELIDSKLDIENSKYFAYLTPSINELLVQESRNGKLAYIETDYFGGVGSQSAVLYDKGAVKIKPIKTETYWDENNNEFILKPEGDMAINLVLNELGVYKEKDKDEFDSINLYKYRRMN